MKNKQINTLARLSARLRYLNCITTSLSEWRWINTPRDYCLVFFPPRLVVSFLSIFQAWTVFFFLKADIKWVRKCEFNNNNFLKKGQEETRWERQTGIERDSERVHECRTTVKEKKKEDKNKIPWNRILSVTKTALHCVTWMRIQNIGSNTVSLTL